MAIFNQIGGISTGSVANVLKGPLNKLLGGKKSGAEMLKFPTDLGNNPARKHVVMFSIGESTPARLNVVKSVTDAATAPDKNLPEKTTAIAQSVTAAAGNIKAELAPEETKNHTYISLFMPDTLAMNYSAEYNEFSVMEKGSLNRILGAVGSVASDFSNGIPDMTDVLVKNAKDFGGEAAGALIERAGVQNGQDIIMKAQNKVINPQMQMIFRGVNMRNFTMEFLFTPKSKEESDQVSAIVNTFIYAQTPTITGGNGMYFTPPSIFTIKFLMAESSAKNDIINSLVNAGNNIIPGVNLGDFAANKLSKKGTNSSSNEPEPLGVENTRLFKVGRCVLTDVSVDYAPNGWLSFKGGAPVQTRLVLSFKEMDIIDRTRMLAGEVR